MSQHDFAGTGTLMRLFLRRDRFLLPIWVLLPPLITLSQVSFARSLPNLQVFLADLVANPLATAILGPVVPLSVAGAVVWRAFVQGALAVGIGSMLTAIRHTRTEEETGRSELLRGGMVGRYASLTAALLLVCAANLLAGLLAALALIRAGEEASGAGVFGLTITVAGWFYAGIGALSAQMHDHAANARGMAFAVGGVGIATMIINNVGGGYTGWAWLSPQIWFRLTHPFDGNLWWVLLLLVILSALPMGAAYVLLTHRDIGSGLLQARPAPSEATSALRGPLSLAWRLHKGTLPGWTIGLACLGGCIGAITQNISGNLGLIDLLPQMGSLTGVDEMDNQEAFLAVAIYILSLLVGVTIYAIMTVLGLRKEEIEHRAETILSRSVSRLRWMSSFLLIAFSGSAYLLLMLGLAVGLAYGLTIGDVGNTLPQILLMCLSKIPAVWVMVGLTALWFGYVPRAASALSWCVLAALVVLEIAWEARLVSWAVMSISPFSSAHYTIPVSELSLSSLFWLTALAAVLTGFGLLGFQRRNIE